MDVFVIRHDANFLTAGGPEMAGKRAFLKTAKTV
jgi:hypothetical protein